MARGMVWGPDQLIRRVSMSSKGRKRRDGGGGPDDRLPKIPEPN